MDKTKKSISLIIEILLMFSIMIAILSIFFRMVVLNKNTYTTILDKNNTYEQVKESIYNKIDVLLAAKNINYDIKESIITEEDIKAEADNMIFGFIEYLKTGENNIKPIDSELYKQRVKVIIDNIIKPNKNDLSFNNNLQAENVVWMPTEIKYNNMIVSKEKSKSGQSYLEVQKLETRSEAEVKVREILKQKGLTEDQAIQKAIDKGITEEQALGILANYGITIDDEPAVEGNQSTAESSDNNNSSSAQGSENTTGNSSEEKSSNSENTIESSSDETSSNSQNENTTNQPTTDKSIKSQLVNKLADEAGSSIEKEIEKINLDKILESSKIKKLTQITSIFYKICWMFMILPIIFSVILIKINGKDLTASLKYIGNALLLAGLILFAIFFGAYALKIYDKLYFNIVYVNDVISYTIKNFLMVLSKCGTITFVIGLFLLILTIKKFK